jgi:hypothetical protein
MSDPKTPAERKKEAITAISKAGGDCGVMLANAYARACIDEAVAPIRNYIENMDGTRIAEFDRKALRKLLTGRAGT